MTNPIAAPQLSLPQVPDDFNGGVGVDFARALMSLLGQITVTGLVDDGADPFDVGQMQEQIETIQTTLTTSTRKERTILMNGVNNGEIAVPFQDIGTIDYTVTYEIVIPTGSDPTPVVVYILDGTKTTSQFRARIDGTGNPYKFLFTVMQNQSSGT